VKGFTGKLHSVKVSALMLRMVVARADAITGTFGSDVYTHYTAAYTWKSNQMAHAMMGLAGTTLLVHAAQRLGLEVWYGAVFFVIPLLKDAADYWVDRSNAGGVFAETSAHRRELLVDGLTDNFFWNIGMALALLMALSGDGTPWFLYLVFGAALLMIVVGVCCVARVLNVEKKRYDASGLPYYFRLPSYTGNRVEAGNAEPSAPRSREGPVAEVERFVYGRDGRAQHLMLVGPPRSSKTTLAAAIGSGLIVRGHAVRYLSQARLEEEFAATSLAGIRSAFEPIHPRDAAIVIADDLTQPTGMSRVLSALSYKSTVWVVDSRDRAELVNWSKVLEGGLNGRLAVVELDHMVQGRNASAPRVLATAFASAALLVSVVAGLGSILSLLLPMDLSVDHWFQ